MTKPPCFRTKWTFTSTLRSALAGCGEVNRRRSSRLATTRSGMWLARSTGEQARCWSASQARGGTPSCLSSISSTCAANCDRSGSFTWSVTTQPSPRSRAVQEDLSRWHHRLRLHFLPRYAPETNPIERVWWRFHETITRNHRCQSLDQLLQQAYRWFDHLRGFFREMRNTYQAAA